MTLTQLKTLDRACQFLKWHFDPSDGKLISKDHTIRLQPRLAKLLSIFVANSGKLLSRDLLVDAIWHSKTVNEDALSRSVAELRRILGDNRASPTYIETVPKKGYRFVCLAEPETLTDNSSPVTNRKRVVYLSLTTAIGFLLLFLVTYGNDQLAKPDTENNLVQTFKTALINSTRLTTNKSLEHQPQLSNEGDKVAFSVSENNRQIVRIIGTNNQLVHQISDPEYHLYSPSFSPKDNFVLVAGLKRGSCTTFIYHLPDLMKEELGPCILPSISPIYDWSPDGNTIAFVGLSDQDISLENKIKKERGAAAIWLWNVKQRTGVQLSFPSGLNIFDTQPKFSPDGSKLGFTRGTLSSRNIVYVSLQDPKVVLKVTKGSAYISSFSWLNTKQDIIFDSNELGDRSLWLVNINQKKPLLLGARDARFPTVNARNTKITYQEVRYNANIWQFKLNHLDAKATPLIESIKYNNFPSYSPDGKSIAFVSNREGKAGVWVYDVATKQQNKLLSIAGLDLIMPSWSKDGKRMLVSSRGAKGYSCYLVDPRSGSYQSLNAFQQSHYGCQYSQEGEIFAVSKSKTEVSQILKFDHNGKTHQLTDSGVMRIQLSSINKIVYTKPNEDGLYSMDLFGGNNQVLIKDFNRDWDGNWLVKDQFLYYPKIGNDRGIWRLNLENHLDEMVTKELPSSIGLTLSVNSEHSQILMSKTDNRIADIYVAEIVPDKQN